MTTSPGPAPLPAEGVAIGFIGKGGSAKSTVIAHLLGHWAEAGLPAAAIDADEPGDEENGSLIEWADLAPLGAPVYPSPGRASIRERVKQLTPAGGILAVDTGAWVRKAGGLHFAVLSAVDLVVVTLPPTRLELERVGSILAALEHLETVGAHCPRMVICQTLTNPSARAADDQEGTLTEAGYRVLRTRIPRSDAMDGYGQAFGRTPRLIPDSPMALLAAELVAVAVEEER